MFRVKAASPKATPERRTVNGERFRYSLPISVAFAPWPDLGTR